MKKNFTFISAIIVTIAAVPAITGASNDIVRDSHSYPLATCPVTELALDAMGGPVIETINDREVRFCCAACIGRYRDNIEAYEADVDAAIIRQQREHYPIDRCVVMDTTLGSMGDPVDYVHGNRLVRFCCAGCVGIFEQDPAKHLAKLDAAALDKMKAEAPEACAVTGDTLGDAPVTLLLANKALLLHSEACVASVRENPAKYLDASGNPNPPGDHNSHASTPVTSNQSHQHDEVECLHDGGQPPQSHEHAAGAAPRAQGRGCSRATGTHESSCCG